MSAVAGIQRSVKLDWQMEKIEYFTSKILSEQFHIALTFEIHKKLLN